MTPNEFIIWFRGFSEACHHLNPTPSQWQKIVDTLKEVGEESKSCTCSPQVYTYPYSKGTAKEQLND